VISDSNHVLITRSASYRLPMHALVVEESLQIRVALRDALVAHGFAVDVAANGVDGLWLAGQNSYDVVVLATQLPLIDGNELMRRLREGGSNVGVVLFAEPFTVEDVIDRARGLVRRRFKTTEPVIRVKDIVVDTVKRRVKRGSEDVPLSPREYALLEYLAARAGQLVSRTEIWEHVYDFRSDAQSNVVDVYVSYLRKKLGDPPMIHTKRGQGYVFGDET
jgi:DNA-binding response OmpR family regulator